jgi:hypothetical protein
MKVVLGTSEYDVTNDGLQAAVIIKVDGRNPTNREAGQSKLEQRAVDLVSDQKDNDHYVIHLKNGHRISESEIYIKTSVSIS